MTVSCKNKILQNSQNYFTYLGYARYYNVENLVHYLAYIGKRCTFAVEFFSHRISIVLPSYTLSRIMQVRT